MAEVLKLKKPLAIDGKDVTELAYDFEQMTFRDTMEVSANMAADGLTVTSMEELDPNYQAYLFAQAVYVTSGQKISIADVMRMSALDGKRAVALTRNFFYMGG